MEFEAPNKKVLILTGNRYDLNGNYLNNDGKYAFKIVDNELPLKKYTVAASYGKVTQIHGYEDGYYSIHYLYNP